ncbi:MAG: hypothetical protein ILP18_08485 [Treponema sp.]|nr:hypothetical protein [Treponema sp.]
MIAGSISVCGTDCSKCYCKDMCADIPCGIWKKTRDPKFSDAEFEVNIRGRIELLNRTSIRET